MSIGVLPSSAILLLGDGSGNVVGDPNTGVEIGSVAGGGSLVKWKSAYQNDVYVPALGGARFTSTVTDLTQPNAVAKALAPGYGATVLANPNFIDQLLGTNTVAASPVSMTPAMGTFPTAGTASTPAAIAPSYPSAGAATTPGNPAKTYPAGGTAATIATPPLTYPATGSYTPPGSV